MKAPNQSRVAGGRRAPTRHRVVVQYMGLLRKTTGQAEETLQVPAGATVRDLLARLREKHPGRFRSQAFDVEGNLLPNIHLFLNDDTLDEAGLDTPLPHQGQLAILLMLHPLEGG